MTISAQSGRADPRKTVYILNQGLLTLQQSDPRAPGSLHAEDEASAMGPRREESSQIIRQGPRVDRLGNVAVTPGVERLQLVALHCLGG